MRTRGITAGTVHDRRNGVAPQENADELDRVDIRLLGPSVDVSLTVTVEGADAVPVREFFLNSGVVRDLRVAS